MLGRLSAAVAVAAIVSAQGPPSGQEPAGQEPAWAEWAKHATASSQQYSQNNGWISPEYTWLFDFPLPIPSVAQPVASQSVNGTLIDFFNVTIDPFQKQIYPNLGPTSLVGYNGTSPGPSYVVESGTQTVHRYVNNGNTGASVHVHGSHARAVWDGWASDMIMPGQFKDYYYPNDQGARTLWYHDHADTHTSEDAYYGQAGSFIIHDVNEDSLNLPTGEYDIPLIIIDKIYGADGSLVSPAGETMNFYGDVMHVNGQPWPFHSVEPRKYRLRLLNCCLSRPLQLALQNDATAAQEIFAAIASDAGIFGAPVMTSSLYVAMGERYDIVVDFAPYANTNLTLTNSLNTFDIPQYNQTSQVMRFVVGDTVTDWSSNELPAVLSTVNFPAPRPTIDHVFNFDHNGQNWTINGVDYGDINARVLARPQQGSSETWQLKYASGPGFHPVHIHLVQFQIISRTGGRGVLEPYEIAGLKDVVLIAPGEIVTVTAYFGPWNGLYMFHCHNLIHEDHQMMDVFNSTANPILEQLGFASSLGFDDPSNTPYVPLNKDYSKFTLEYITDTLLPDFANSDAYKNEPEIAAALSAYYATAPPYVEAATASSAASSYGYPSGGNQGPPAAAAATATGVVPSAYSPGAPFTFTDSIPNQVSAASIAIVQATNTAIVETVYFPSYAFAHGARPSGSYGPPAGLGQPSGNGGPPAGFGQPSAVPAAPVSTVAAAAPAPVPTTPAAAPPAQTTAAPAPVPVIPQQFSAPAHSWGPPANAGPPAAPSAAPSVAPPAPPPAPTPAAPSQPPPTPAPAPPAAQSYGPPAEFTHPSGPPQGAPSAAPPAPAPAPPAPSAPAPAPAAPPAQSWSPPAAPAQPQPQNHPGAPGFFSGSNAAPQAAPQAAPPTSGGGSSPGWGNGHTGHAVAGVAPREAAALPGIGVEGGLKTGSGRAALAWRG